MSLPFHALSSPLSKVLDVKDPPPAGRCFHTKAYMADVTGFGLVVYDSQLNTSWRVQNKLFYPNPYYGTHNVADEQFDLMDGLFGLALSPRTPYGKLGSACALVAKTPLLTSALFRCCLIFECLPDTPPGHNRQPGAQQPSSIFPCVRQQHGEHSAPECAQQSDDVGGQRR